MFVIDPDPYLLPAYRISPFQTGDISRNRQLELSCEIDDYFRSRFPGSEFIYTLNGREALHLALRQYMLKREDIVTILTTSGNFYISSCVTAEIEKFSKWTREPHEKTRMFLVNHEFGYPFEDFQAVREAKIPVIEDYAHTFFFAQRKESVGIIGEYAIYSFPKMFPLQIGGLLVANNGKEIPGKSRIRQEELTYVKSVLSYYIRRHEQIIEKRLKNYRFLSEQFQKLGFRERFPLKQGVVPGVFMFKAGGHGLNLAKLKQYFYAHGVQCSVFYGEETFFLPCHQRLVEGDLLYFGEVMKSFIELKGS